MYKILQLRTRAFVVEQKGIYQDMDNKDFTALHLQGFIDGEIVAYCRMFKAGDYFENASIGRVTVPIVHRKKGYGHLLIDKSIEIMSRLLHEPVIDISAQAHLKSFYEVHRFECISEEYLEDGIPHIRMKRAEK